jgi:hypothetical protein
MFNYLYYLFFSKKFDTDELKKIDFEIENNLRITGNKKRTISTLSDLKADNISNENFSRNKTESNEKEKEQYYRLASCGQDNQICFWDITDDLLEVGRWKNQNTIIPNRPRNPITREYNPKDGFDNPSQIFNHNDPTKW